MRFVRTIAGMVLLTIGLPMLLVSAPLRAGAPPLPPLLDWLGAGGGWLLPAVGAATAALGLAALAWPTRPRPREVVFVVEPDQVPVLAARMGITSLSDLGRTGAPAGPAPGGAAGPAGGAGIAPDPAGSSAVVVPLPVRPVARVPRIRPAAPDRLLVGCHTSCGGTGTGDRHTTDSLSGTPSPRPESLADAGATRARTGVAPGAREPAPAGTGAVGAFRAGPTLTWPLVAVGPPASNPVPASARTGVGGRPAIPAEECGGAAGTGPVGTPPARCSS